MAYKTFLTALSTALIATAAPAAAGSKPQARPEAQKICIQYSSETGSRLVRLECRTKDEWQRLGVELDDVSQPKGK